MTPLVSTPESYKLLHDTQIALARVQATGVRVDHEYLGRAITKVDTEIVAQEAALRADPLYLEWRKLYGSRTNPRAPEQLAKLVFGALGFKAPRRTKSGKRDAADESAFEGVDLPIVKSYFAAAKLRKGRDTYLHGIRREMARHADGDWYIHPSYNLNTVATFRSSCNLPNWQNQPNRNPLIAEMVRRSYIPRRGRQIVEVDLGQIEVRVPCFYHSDPNLMAYVNDPTKDMHRDVAAQLFKLEGKQVSKMARHVAKNMTVFPFIYGSFWAQVAPAVWAAVDANKLTVEGTQTTLRDHLTAVGFKELGCCDPDAGDPAPGTFAAHVRAVERDFWNVRFPVFAQWKKDWYQAYLEAGGFRMLTGFAVRTHLGKEGLLSRRQVNNYPIQGVAAHILWWALVRMVRWLVANKMESLVIGQIHDCMVMDCPSSERDDVVHHAVYLMTEGVRRAWSWINTSLTAEAEVCPIDRPWYEKVGMVERAGRYEPADMAKWNTKYGEWT